MTHMTQKTISLAEAKKRLSELVVRAAYGREEFVITRRGRPAAVLMPLRESPARDLSEVRGWIAPEDSFFRFLRAARTASRERGPRADRG